MSETLLASIMALVGLLILCLASVVLAVKLKDDRAVTWHGFGVSFTIAPCRRCPRSTRSNSSS